MAGQVARARASVAALETLAEIRAQARTVATEPERETLAGWSGWGPLAPMFAPKDATWDGIAERVRELLPAGDVDTGMQGTYNAFYTPPAVARVMWRILAGLGFTGGRVLEPGCGGGVFMGEAPDGAAMVGVERDPTAADVCRLRHPGAEVVTGEFQSVRLAGGFAAAIGNVPFGDVRVADPIAPRAVTSALHNYFLWRAVDLLAPGGVAVLLTSRHTMDAIQQGAREEIGKLADFLGAVRLPCGALGGGTDAIADVVILRRRAGGRPAGHSWADSGRLPGLPEPVNTWWSTRPGALLGEHVAGSTSRYGLGLLVQARPGDPEPADGLTRAAGELVAEAHAAGLGWTAPADVADLGDTSDVVTADGWHEGTMRTDGQGRVLQARGGRLVVKERPSAELLALLGLRDLAVRLIEAEADHARPDEQITPLREQTARAYAAYVRRWGPLNRSRIVEGEPDEDTGLPTYSRRVPAMGGFRHDPDAPLVFALEVFDEETGQAQPAPILSARQNLPTRREERTDDPARALAWCLDRTGGRVDLDLIAGMLDVDPGQVPALLGDAVFCEPDTRQWVTAEHYLSGDVRAKHAVACRAAKLGAAWQRNADALAAVVPAWLGPAEITANLSAPWIPAEDVAAFVEDLLGQRVDVRHVVETAQWEVDAPPSVRGSVAATEQWGTPEVDAFRLIGLALNGKVPTVYRSTGDGRKVKDDDATMLACQRQQQIRERFAAWVWEDADRSDRLCEIYNHRFNSHAPRRFSGEHITVDGLAPGFEPYPHQLEYVARALATPAALCGHPVGAGKTATMAMTAAKLRQTGLARKPLVAVPNHLIEQVDREFRQLLPAARILTASAATIRANRRAFAARCATGDWDVVIITHSAFSALPVAAETEKRYLEAQEEALRAAVVAASPDGRLKGRMVKALAKRLDNLKARIVTLRNRVFGSDRGVTFEQLGVDHVLIDEAHYFKNLALPVRTDGFSVRPSKRATDLDMKLRWLAQRGSRYASLFSGTPVSNTMLELYVILQYTMPDRLAALGMPTADAWAATFVQFSSEVEVTVDGGGFRLRTRPRRFVNAPELRLLLSQVADIRTADQLGLPRPGADERLVTVPPTAAQRDYSARLVERAEAVRASGWKPEKGADNMLAVCTDGRRMATDPALVGLRDPDPGKLDRVAATVADLWRAHPDELQIVFLDIGTPNPHKGTQTYGRLRALMDERGIPAERVRFVHSARTDGERAQLFADCRAGRVSVVMGSTDKLGVGTNIQPRVVAMHHVDAPYRPADVEQRDGRGLRPGNRHTTVGVYRYVTERTFDAYMWQMLHRKAGFVTQVLSGVVDRTVDDCTADQVISFEAVKAAATGQPLLMEKAKLEADVAKLRNLQRAHAATVRRLGRDLPDMRRHVEAITADADAWRAVAAAATGLADGDAERAHELMQRYGHAEPGDRFGGVSVGFGQWWDQSGESPERHPLVMVDGGAGAVTMRATRHWTADKLAARLGDMLTGAGAWVARLDQQAADMRAEIARGEQLQAQPFEHGDELARVLARLDQIDAALHEAATDQPLSEAAGGIVVDSPDLPTAGDGDDLDAIAAALAGEFSDLFAEVAADLAGVFAELDEPAPAAGSDTMPAEFAELADLLT